MGVMTRRNYLLAFLLVLTSCGSQAQPTSSGENAVPEPLPNAPFDSDNVDELGFQPDDIPGGRYTFGPEAPGAEPSDEPWREHLRNRGFKGRWWSDFNTQEALLFSRISLWGGTRQATDALEYESGRRDGMRGLPIGPLIFVPGLGEEGWCQLLERGNLDPETTCRFRVANATIDVIARTTNAPISLERVQELAMMVSERAEALARR